MFEEPDLVFNTSWQFPQTVLTNPLKLRIYLCKILTVITESTVNQILLADSIVNILHSQKPSQDSSVDELRMWNSMYF